LFYLQSRGLSKDIAKAILIYGFAEEVIVEVSDKNIRAQLVDFVKQDLENIIHESNNE
jgi:Fe-S cluster assembly scaffold protein SufB